MKNLIALMLTAATAQAFTVTNTVIGNGEITIKTPQAAPADMPTFEVADQRYGRFIPAQAQWKNGAIKLTYESHASLKEQQKNVVWRCSDGTKSFTDDIPFRAVPPTKFPAVGRLKVACVGDSITFGLGIPQEENKYPEQLQKILGDKFEVGRFGNSAKTAARVKDGVWFGLQKEHRQALDFKADLYISNLGINDTNRGTWDTEKVFADYAELVRAWSGPQGATIMLWTKLAPDFRSVNREPGFPGNVNKKFDFPLREMDTATRRPEMEGICTRIAKELHCHPIDMYSPLVKHPENTIGDGLHPNPEGAKIIAEETAKAIRKLWSKK